MIARQSARTVEPMSMCMSLIDRAYAHLPQWAVYCVWWPTGLFLQCDIKRCVVVCLDLFVGVSSCICMQGPTYGRRSPCNHSTNTTDIAQSGKQHQMHRNNAQRRKQEKHGSLTHKMSEERVFNRFLSIKSIVPQELDIRLGHKFQFFAFTRSN